MLLAVLPIREASIITGTPPTNLGQNSGSVTIEHNKAMLVLAIAGYEEFCVGNQDNLALDLCGLPRCEQASAVAVSDSMGGSAGHTDATQSSRPAGDIAEP